MTVTIQAFLQQAVARISDSGVSHSELLDAEVILAHAMSVSRVYLIANPRETIGQTALSKAGALLLQRCDGVPIAYIVGYKEFWSLEFKVNEAVLIPRPDSEIIVQRALEKTDDGGSRLADLGTGSGAIAVAIASEMPHSEVVAVDRSTAALDMAEKNALKVGVRNILFFESDWYQNLGNEQFEIIVANPPYIAEKDPHLLGEVRFEPQQALVAGDSGYSDLSHIIQFAPDHLRPGGWLLVEHGYDQGNRVRQTFAEHGFSEISTMVDLAGNERVTEGRLAR